MSPISEVALEDKLERLLRKLTPRQAEFLSARKSTNSDAEACRLCSMSDTAVPRWKKDNNFMQAYVITTEMIDAQREMMVSDVNKRAIIRSQMTALMAFLPQAVQEHLNIIKTAPSIEFRLRAIKQLYDTVGIGPESELPISKNNQALQNIFKLLAPQAYNEATKRGMDVDAGIKDIVDSALKEGVVSPEAVSVAEELDEPVDESIYDDDDDDVIEV